LKFFIHVGLPNVVFTGVYVLENTPPPPPGGEISADVIWGKKYEKWKRKREKEGKCKRKSKKGEVKGRKGKE
jgi:hypothetical protein